MPSPPNAPVPPSPQSRLARALDLLGAALAEQAQSAAALRDASARLKTTLADLQARLESHRDGLDRLAGAVALVNGQSCRLQSWADGAARRDGSAG
ncbi:MAG: hypothetical protein HC829_05450 [Bacteroidales bacterium]|nr:hypothetical protein [Bacteroidales bacterium]